MHLRASRQTNAHSYAIEEGCQAGVAQGDGATGALARLAVPYRCGESLPAAALSWGDLVALSGAVAGASTGLGKARFGTPGHVSGKFGPCPSRIPFASTIDHRQSSSALGVIPMFSRKMVVLNGLAVALR